MHYAYSVSPASGVGLLCRSLCRWLRCGGAVRLEGWQRPGDIDPGYMSRKNRKIRADIWMRVTNRNFDSCNSCNSCKRAVYMSCMSQNFRLLHVSNLSVRNFRIFLLMYPGSVTWTLGSWGTPPRGRDGCCAGRVTGQCATRAAEKLRYITYGSTAWSGALVWRKLYRAHCWGSESVPPSRIFAITSKPQKTSNSTPNIMCLIRHQFDRSYQAIDQLQVEKKFRFIS